MVEIGLQVIVKLRDAPLQDKEEASKGIKFFIFQLQYKSINLEIIVKTSHVATGFMETMRFFQHAKHFCSFVYSKHCS